MSETILGICYCGKDQLDILFMALTKWRRLKWAKSAVYMNKWRDVPHY